jgi:hypothetical protein
VITFKIQDTCDSSAHYLPEATSHWCSVEKWKKILHPSGGKNPPHRSRRNQRVSEVGGLSVLCDPREPTYFQ